MFTPELLSLLGGGLTGFLFRYLAEKRQDQKEIFDRLLTNRQEDQKSQDAAVKRVPHDAGKAVRRFIVMIILFGAVVAPFILPFFGIPTVVETIQKNPEFLFGLIPAQDETTFTPIYGYYYSQAISQVLISIIGFYFGNAAASNKS
jgi:hypothetical protein